MSHSDSYISSRNGSCNTAKGFLESKSHIHVFHLEEAIPQDHGLHRHDFFSMDYIYRGEFLQYINGKECLCKTGTVCLLSPFDNHKYINTESASMISIVFSDDVIPDKLWEALDIDSAPFLAFFDETDNERIKEDFFTIIKESSDKSDMSTIYIMSLLNKLIIDVLRKSSGEISLHPKKYDSVHKSISYVRYHFREPITLEDTARKYHVTPAHFCKYFKKHTGSTFKEYLVELRLDYAMRLIKNSDKSITDICFESGFSSPSYFTKAFFKRFAQKPSDIRK